ncbi:MAG: MTH1187 family thiamine-binding protein [Acidimicrobiia bacterium]
MRVVVDLCVVPIGVGVSVSEYVAACERVIAEAGLEHRLHAYGTNIEGDWDGVMAAVRRCHEVVHEMGAPRISTSMRLGTRVDRMQSMDDKIQSVTAKLREDPG